MNETKTAGRPHIARPEQKTRKRPSVMTHRTPKREPALECSIVADENGFLSLRSEWNDLVEHSPVFIYQTFDWQWFWWKHYGGANRLHIAVYRSEGMLVGIIPTFLQPHTLFGKRMYTRLRMIGCGVDSKENIGLPSEYGPSDYLDALILPEFAAKVAEEFALSVLTGGGGTYDEVQFQCASQTGAIQRYFVPAFAAHGLRWAIKAEETCPYLSVPASVSLFHEGLRPGTRHRIKQAKKEFIQTAPFSIETVKHRSTLDHAFRDLIYLHQFRWNMLGYAGLFSDRRYCSFQKDIVHSFFDQGFLWFKAVRMGGIRTAARLGFTFKGRMYDYLSGFDETLPGAKKRPSLALLIEMIEDAIGKDAGVVDLLRGQESYKFELTHESSRNAEILVPVPGSPRSVRRFLYRFVRLWGAIARKCADEWTLLRIQKEIHGGVKFLWTYAMFVFTRVKAKLSGSKTQ